MGNIPVGTASAEQQALSEAKIKLPRDKFWAVQCPTKSSPLVMTQTDPQTGEIESKLYRLLNTSPNGRTEMSSLIQFPVRTFSENLVKDGWMKALDDSEEGEDSENSNSDVTKLVEGIAQRVSSGFSSGGETKARIREMFQENLLEPWETLAKVGDWTVKEEE